MRISHIQAWGRAVKARAWSETRRILGRYPSVYFGIGYLRGEIFQERKVTRDTDIVIEGYPRSANSFAVGAFRAAQATPFNIAHHHHVPAQIVRAWEFGIPTILLVRHPVDAIISHRSLLREGEMVDGRIRDGLRMSFRPFFRTWIDFYETTQRYADSIVVGPFDQVVNDFGQILKAVNAVYDTEFAIFDHTKVNEKRVNEERGYHAGPSVRRQRLKKEVRAKFQHFRRKNPEIVQKATDLYEMFEQKNAEHNSL